MLNINTGSLVTLDPFALPLRQPGLHLRLVQLADQLIRVGAREMVERQPELRYKIAVSESAAYFYEEIDGSIEGIDIGCPWIDARI